MKKALKHLPKHKQQELKLINETIAEPYPGVQMVILFGSYARGKDDYRITKKQLEYLATRVKILQKLTKRICTEKIKSYA